VRYRRGLINPWWYAIVRRGPAVGQANKLTGTTLLSSELFAGGNYGASDSELFKTVVHEEEHHTGLFGRGEKAAEAAEDLCS
jgi:hypothetical protein